MQWAKKRETEWKFDLKGLPAQEVKFADLGLADDREYVVFEFWTQTFIGRAKGAFTAPAMDENNGMQVFAVREARPHPWVLSTTRHVSQGGACLLAEEWDARLLTLSGKSAVIAGDPYALTTRSGRSSPRALWRRTAAFGPERSSSWNRPSPSVSAARIVAG